MWSEEQISQTVSAGLEGGPPATDWEAWHHDYADPGSALSGRLAIVRSAIRQALADAPAGTLTVLSACAGDGRDILGVLAERQPEPGRQVQATLLEADLRNLERARQFCERAGLTGVSLRAGDAGLAASYAGVVPADLVLMCGVFGNISDQDVRRLIGFLPRLCRAGATLIWTRSRRAPDLTPQLREWLAGAGFTELSFTAPPDVLYSVGVHRFAAADPAAADLPAADPAAADLPAADPAGLAAADERLFTFIR